MSQRQSQIQNENRARSPHQKNHSLLTRSWQARELQVVPTPRALLV